VWQQHWQQVRQSFWDPRSLADKPLWLRITIPVLRTGYAIGRDWWDGELTLRAMSLVYTTLLSLVPLLAVSFSVLKAFGVHNQIEPMLAQGLAPLGPKGTEITSSILSFVDHMQVGVLGTLGLAVLFYTVVALMQKIEASFNYTWHVKELRSIGERFSHYLSVLMIGPVLVFSAVGLSATLMSSDWMQQLLSIEPLGSLAAYSARLLPTLMIVAAFTFMYMFIPNTEVRLRSALVGAVVAGILWQSVGFLFASLVVGSARYTAIYSALATLILFMIWLYVGWLILLIGASVAHYHQNPARLLSKSRRSSLSARQQRLFAHTLLALIQARFIHAQGGARLLNLSQQVSLPADQVDYLLHKLEGLGYLTQCADKRWQPGRDLARCNIAELWQGLEQINENSGYDTRHCALSSEVEALEQERGQLLQQHFAKRSICDPDKIPDTPPAATLSNPDVLIRP